MRRLLSTAVLTAVLSSALVVLPVAAEPTSPKPHPVRSALRTSQATAATTTFSTVGATWDRGSTGTVQVRARSGRTWTAWTTLEKADYGPDTGSLDDRLGAREVVSGPVWVGPSQAYETRTTGHVTGLRVVTVDAGTSDADALGAPVRGAASAEAAQPLVYTRAQWGADESLRSFNGSGCTTPDYSSTVKVGFVHHTDGANDYTADDVPSVIRGIYAYHVKTNGWCDVGYNFLVDSFGRVWEGRYGGIVRPVIGAHTGGHNGSTFGAALLGTYTDVTPSPRMVDAVERLFAWKLAKHYRDPRGTAQLTSGGGGTSKYPDGSTNTFDVVSGHRDAGNTECPGNAAYALLPTSRTDIATLMGAGLVGPAQTATTAAYAGTGITVSAGVLKSQTWTLDVRRTGGDGMPVRTYTGLADTSLSQLVDLKDATGAWLPAGAYTLTLSSNAGPETAVPWVGTLDITAPPPGPEAPVATTFTAVTPTRVLDTRTGLGTTAAGPLGAQGRVTVKVAGTAGVPATGVAAVAVNLTGLATGPTFLSAYPADTVWPGTSSLNLAAGQTHAALVVPKLSPDGSVTVYNGTGSTDAVLDVVGWYATAGASTFTPVTPTRVLDTRTDRTPFGPGTTRTLTIGGTSGVPSDATAVVANVTLTGVTGPGYATVFPAGAARPETSTVNALRGETATNRFVVGLAGGKLSLATELRRADVIVDVVGWYGGSAGRSYSPLPPSRVLDTRSGNGVATGKVLGGSTTRVVVGGRGGVPADATAAVLTLTTTGVTQPGYVTAWSGSGPRPGVSDVNTWEGHDVANLVVVQLAARGMYLFNAGDAVHLVGDVIGFYR